MYVNRYLFVGVNRSARMKILKARYIVWRAYIDRATVEYSFYIFALHWLQQICIYFKSRYLRFINRRFNNFSCLCIFGPIKLWFTGKKKWLLLKKKYIVNNFWLLVNWLITPNTIHKITFFNCFLTYYNICK